MAKPLTIPTHPIPDSLAAGLRETTLLRGPTSITLITDNATDYKPGSKDRLNVTGPSYRKDKVVIDVVGQYNNTIGRKSVKPNLNYRRLPPVKLSFHPASKSKFVPTPSQTDLSSRILKPHLGQSTNSAAHHIFTEGISSSSEIPQPSFALPLQQLKVPYSNLPDSISIFREKDQFAFSVRDDEHIKSPYKLAPLASASMDKLGDRTGAFDRGDSRLTEFKRNIVKLEPLFGYNGDASPLESCRQMSNLKVCSPSPNMSKRQHYKNKRLSIVSIGDTVAESVDEISKREMRKLYPMYDNQARKNELYNRTKFKLDLDRRPKQKPKQQNSTFTYKVSVHQNNFKGFADSAPPPNPTPIKNNLHEMRNKRYRGESRLRLREGEYTMYSDYSHRNGRQMQGPKSAESGSSGMVSVLPTNPPPSIISHIVSEYDHNQPELEHHNELLTLLEERTMTNSHMSVTVRDVKSAKVALEILNQGPVEDQENFENAEIEKEKNNQTTVISQTSNTLIPSKSDSSSTKDAEQGSNPDNIKWYKACGGDDDYADIIENPNILAPEQMASPNGSINLRTDKSFLKKESSPPVKQQLKVPTHQLDALNHQPIGVIARERTSLSRLLENTFVFSDAPTVKCKPDDTQPDKLVVSVQKLQLFPEPEPPIESKNPTPDALDEDKVLVDPDLVLQLGQVNPGNAKQSPKRSTSDNKNKSSAIEKVVVNNANISFISPLVTDTRAKRQ